MRSQTRVLSKVRRHLKKAKLWSKYKRRFDKQLRLVLTRIALSINSEVSVNALSAIEQNNANITELNARFFQSQLAQIGVLTGFECNWNALGQYLFLKHEAASQKRLVAPTPEAALKAFFSWLHSVPLTTENYNLIVKKVMRVILK